MKNGCEKKKSKAFLPHIFFLCLLFIAINVASGLTEPLDIYNSQKHFPTNLVFPENRIPDLGQLKDEQINENLQGFLSAAKKIQGPGKTNPLYLAIGYLYLKKEDSQNALRYLDQHITGNFILEDYRLQYQAEALNLSGRVKLENKEIAHGMRELNESMDKRMKIFQVYPESPLNSNIQPGLAETEKLLGDAYFYIRNYKAAWRFYRRSLMREFPDSQEHRLKVNLSLAKTYEATGDLRNAVEIYLYLLKNFRESVDDFKIPVEQFLKKNASTLNKMQMDLTPFKALDSFRKTDVPVFGTPEKVQEEKPVQYEIELFNEFYQALGQNDLISAVENAKAILIQYPGLYDSRQILQRVNNFIVERLEEHVWNESIDRLTELYPAGVLADLAMRLWKKGRHDGPARLFEKILKNHPLETLWCHKAAFFLGRILEDGGNYPEAIKYYDQLLKQYDFGPFTPAALFKIAWIERLQGRFDLSEQHFQISLDFYETENYRRWAASFDDRSSYLPASLFWKAQLANDKGKRPEIPVELKQLVDKHPFDFYAIISRNKLNRGLKEFFQRDEKQNIAQREPGLGETEQKHLQRAETLIAVGFLKEGIGELKKIPNNGQRKDFLFYLSKLLHQGKGFQKSIQMTWSISRQDRSNGLTGDLAVQLFPQAYIDKVSDVAKKYGLDPLWVLSLMRQESAFNAEIVSSSDAIGLMQLLPSTAAEVASSMDQQSPSIDELKDPETNIRLGISYLSHLLSKFNGNVVFALAGYNAGPNKVSEWVGLRSQFTPLEFIESIPYQETRDYVKKVIRNFIIYSVLYRDKETVDLNEILTIPRE